jgi:hypothetical protein
VLVAKRLQFENKFGLVTGDGIAHVFAQFTPGHGVIEFLSAACPQSRPESDMVP